MLPARTNEQEMGWKDACCHVATVQQMDNLPVWQNTQDGFFVLLTSYLTVVCAFQRFSSQPVVVLRNGLLRQISHISVKIHSLQAISAFVCNCVTSRTSHADLDLLLWSSRQDQPLTLKYAAGIAGSEPVNLVLSNLNHNRG